MPAPRVFVSSTAYDLGLLRGQLRSFVAALGFDPVLSEYADILYDPRTHTHTSCVKEVPACDLLVLIIGSRFGSEAIADAIADIDIEALEALSTDTSVLKEADRKLTVTQLEVLKAIEGSLPVFAFVDERVLQDHATYEANRHQSYVDEMLFASISEPKSARYIFSFIDFLRGRLANNAVFPFTKIEDIESQLRRQWASLFQRMLEEERQTVAERQRIDRLSEQFEDLKTAILTTIGDAPTRDVARGVLTFRFLMDALRGLDIPDLRSLLEDGATWDEVMEAADIALPDGVLFLPEDTGPRERETVILERRSGQRLRSRMSGARFRRLPDEWNQILGLPPPARLAIYDALAEVRGFGPASFVPIRPAETQSAYDEEPF
jgi:hypothetical protein